MPHWSTGRTRTLVQFLAFSLNNSCSVFVVVHSFRVPSLTTIHRQTGIVFDDKQRIVVLQVSNFDMMEQGGGNGNTPGYELQSFQLTTEERQQLQYVETADTNHDDYDYQTQYSTTDSQIILQQAANHDDDVHWSIRSNAFFVAGGVIYLVATSWDWNIYSQQPNVDDLHNLLNTPQYIFYQLLWIMGPFVYLLNSSIDVKWALLQRVRDAQEKERDLRRSHLEAILNTSSPQQQQYQQQKRNKLRINAILKRPKNLLRRMRKHIGHRRQLGAATTFGIAAALSVIAALLGLFVTDGSDNISQESKDMLSIWVGWLESGSIHMYLVSAIFALWRSPWKSSSSSSMSNALVEPIIVNVPWYSRTESLETLGDIFFGVAAMVDVCLQDSTLDDGIYWWPVVSAVLWLMDALFYLRGDFATLYKE